MFIICQKNIHTLLAEDCHASAEQLIIMYEYNHFTQQFLFLVPLPFNFNAVRLCYTNL